jgi:ABC-type transport system involved in multi-copper enzyme maturation permease subunit
LVIPKGDEMDAPAAAKRVRINRLLPYWAVFQADVHQTLRSWVYRTWVLVSVSAAVGYLLYHVGLYQKAGIIQPASTLVSELLRWTVLGSVTLIIVLTAGSISYERGTMADSVLSRGISRYQYFLGKWHARLATILGTYFVMGLLALIGGYFLLHEDLKWSGSLLALATVAALLGAVVSCGVAVSAMVNSTVLGIAILWFALYGSGFILSLLPARVPAPDRLLNQLPDVLRGYYNLHALGRLMGWSALASCGVALIGLVYFSRRDV